MMVGMIELFVLGVLACLMVAALGKRPGRFSMNRYWRHWQPDATRVKGAPPANQAAFPAAAVGIGVGLFFASMMITKATFAGVLLLPFLLVVFLVTYVALRFLMKLFLEDSNENVHRKPAPMPAENREAPRVVRELPPRQITDDGPWASFGRSVAVLLLGIGGLAFFYLIRSDRAARQEQVATVEHLVYPRTDRFEMRVEPPTPPHPVQVAQIVNSPPAPEAPTPVALPASASAASTGESTPVAGDVVTIESRAHSNAELAEMDALTRVENQFAAALRSQFDVNLGDWTPGVPWLAREAVVKREVISATPAEGEEQGNTTKVALTIDMSHNTLAQAYEQFRLSQVSGRTNNLARAYGGLIFALGGLGICLRLFSSRHMKPSAAN